MDLSVIVSENEKEEGDDDTYFDLDEVLDESEIIELGALTQRLKKMKISRKELH